jgi:hypothetical protein
MATRILRISDFINEEMVHAGDRPLGARTPGSDLNKAASIFGGDPHKIRQYMSQVMPGQDLELIGSGAYGLAFTWRRLPGLPTEFWDGVSGIDPGDHKTVVKLTSQEREAKEVFKIMDASRNSSLPGIVRYYWVKELAPIKGRKDRMWIFCMESLEPLSMRDRDVIDMLSALEDYFPGTNSYRAQVIEQMLSSDSMGTLARLAKSYLASLGGRSGISLLRRIAKGLDDINKSAVRLALRTEDLHHGNMGWRGTKLVAFDF